MTTSGWIGVDLDGTLAEYHGWVNENYIGAPIPTMVERVKTWLAAGITVKIFTARVAYNDAISPESQKRGDDEFVSNQVRIIQDWCLKNIGQVLDVTATKDYGMIELWDDRCVRVKINTGEII